MFKLVSEYKPTGDQPQAIEYLSNGILSGKKFQTLLGVTRFTEKLLLWLILFKKFKNQL
jgi:excinuclease UvrABC helicase subunit UvrB